MLIGKVNEYFEPIIEIKLLLPEPHKAFAVIDTGFNGYLSIPRHIVDRSNWKFIGHDEYELASGEILKEKVYLGEMAFDGERMMVYALANNTSDILVGTKLLKTRILTINFKDRIVRIKKA